MASDQAPTDSIYLESESELLPKNIIDTFVRKILTTGDLNLETQPFEFGLSTRGEPQNLHELRSALFFPFALRATSSKFAEESEKSGKISTKVVGDIFEDDHGKISAYRVMPTCELDNNSFLFHLFITTYSSLSYARKHMDVLSPYDEYWLLKSEEIKSLLSTDLTSEDLKSILNEARKNKASEIDDVPTFQLMYYQDNSYRKNFLEEWNKSQKEEPHFWGYVLQPQGSGYSVPILGKYYDPFTEKGIDPSATPTELDYIQLKLTQDLITQAEQLLLSNDGLLELLTKTILDEYQTHLEEIKRLRANGMPLDDDANREVQRLALHVGLVLDQAISVIAAGFFMPKLIESLKELATKNIGLLK